MNIKSLITTSVIALISASAAQAADVVIPHESAPVITVPAFSWTGFYLGAQIGGLSTNDSKRHDDTKRSVKLSGMVGGLYAGYNVDVGGGVVFGIDTDVALAGKKDTLEFGNVILIEHEEDKDHNIPARRDITTLSARLKKANITVKEGYNIENGDDYTEGFTLKEKWKGATRIHIGFAADRVMPYLAGGVAYTQMQGTQSIKVNKSAAKGAAEIASGNLTDETKAMIGFTLGGGVDFAMTDNVLLRAEYRYSDYGKKKFINDTAEFTYKTNDFRVGVAYKF